MLCHHHFHRRWLRMPWPWPPLWRNPSNPWCSVVRSLRSSCGVTWGRWSSVINWRPGGTLWCCILEGCPSLESQSCGNSKICCVAPPCGGSSIKKHENTSIRGFDAFCGWMTGGFNIRNLGSSPSESGWLKIAYYIVLSCLSWILRFSDASSHIWKVGSWPITLSQISPVETNIAGWENFQTKRAFE